MHDTAIDACAHRSGYELNPHLSLLYKSMDEDEQARLSQTLTMPDEPFLFDRVQAVAMESPFTIPQQIARRRTLYDSKKDVTGSQVARE